MTCLAIDTSGNHLTALIIKDNDVYGEYISDVNLKHSVTLMTEIENLLLSSGIKLSEVDVFCAVTGPGSFTGIRIGVSTVKALAYAFNKKVLEVTSFETLAYNSDKSKVLAVIDAKHQNYYVCGFNNYEIELKPCFISFDELSKLVKDYKVYSNVSLDIEHSIADIKNGLIKAVKSKLHLATFERESLVPLYVKKSQAEEEAK